MNRSTGLVIFWGTAFLGLNVVLADHNWRLASYVLNGVHEVFLILWALAQRQGPVLEARKLRIVRRNTPE